MKLTMFKFITIILAVWSFNTAPVNGGLTMEMPDVFALVGEKKYLVCTVRRDKVVDGPVSITMKTDNRTVGSISQTSSSLTSLSLAVGINTDFPRNSQLFFCIMTGGNMAYAKQATYAVREIPDTPSGMTSECSPNLYQAKVRWTPGNNLLQVKNFTVQYTISSDPDQWRYAMAANASAVTATIDLKPWLTYYFRVIARNEAADSDPSNVPSAACTTPVAKPWYNPEDVTSIGNKKGYLVINWKPMTRIDHNAPGFKYYVNVVKQNDSTFDRTVVIDDWSTGEREFYTNDIFTPYNVKVWAENDIGRSREDAENYILYSGEGEPVVQVELLEIGRVEITNVYVASVTFIWKWNTAMERLADMNGVFRGFKLKLWPPQSMDPKSYTETIEILKEDLVMVPDCENQGEYYSSVVEHLDASINYEAEISVMNTYYNGPTTHVSFKTEATSIQNLVTDCCSSNQTETEVKWQINKHRANPKGIQGRLSNIRFLLLGKQISLNWYTEMNHSIPIESVNVTEDRGDLVSYQISVGDLSIGKSYLVSIEPIMEHCSWSTPSKTPFRTFIAKDPIDASIRHDISKVQILIIIALIVYIF